MATKEQYLAVRHIIQYILVPIIFVIGFLGNAVSIIVLTRKRMRCSTNIYLTGLAVADIVYLTMLLIMSAQHYKTTQQIAIFWRCRGLFQWLIDGSSYISLYIVVCFTIERYIAVCHPMKGQVFCTEERAKKVLAVVVIVIFLSILSANFEFELVEYDIYVNNTSGELCDQLKLNQTNILSKSSPNLNTTSEERETITTKSNIPDDQYYYDSSTLPSSLSLLSSPEFDIDIGSNTSLSKGNLDDNTQKFLIAATETSTTTATLITGIKKSAFIDGNFYNSYKSSRSGCHYIKRYKTKESSLALNETYRKTFDIFSIIIYSFVPLILIIIFNTFLIRAVQKSNRLRKTMTNMSVRQIKQQQQENKITIVLIAVVILFIICQTPWAIYLFVDNYTDFMDGNLKRICGNIFNTLVAIDAASNFILYCVLSDKYRKTLKELLMGYKYRKQDTSLSRQGTLASSWYNYSYKSFKKPTSNPNSNTNNENGSQNYEMRKTMLRTAKQRAFSSLSQPQTPSANQNSSTNFICVSTKDNDADGNNVSTDAIVNISSKTSTNKTNNGVSSSFRHKLSNDDKRRLQLRPTVSFSHPSQKLPISTSPTKSFSMPFNYEQQHRQKLFNTSTTPDGIKLEHQKGLVGNRIRQNSVTSELAFRIKNNNCCNTNNNDRNDNSNKNHSNGVSNIVMTNILKLSDSSGSLTRSQSLIIQPKTKHSPDCPSFDSNF